MRAGELAALGFVLWTLPLYAQQSETGPEQETGATEARTRKEDLVEKRQEKANQLTPYEVSDWEARTRGWEKAKFPQNIFVKGWNGLRPVIGGMPSGSGFVLGGGYIHGLEDEYFMFQANGRLSAKGYKTADAEVVFPPPQVGRRFELKGRAEYRDLTSLRFYGVGNDSTREDRSTYFLNDTSLNGLLWLNPRGLLSFGAETGWVRVETGPGDEGKSVDQVFEPGELTGFGLARTEYGVIGGWVEFDIRNKWQEPPVGVEARVTTLRYDDTGLHRFDFTRVVGDIKVYVPLGYRSRILALRFRTSHATADDGQEVPFYLMETLGGAKTIRGYDEYRFRDIRNLLLQVEYRWEIWAYLDFSFFFDAGKVFSHMEDFNLKDLHEGYGFGVRVHAPGGMRLRIDLARGQEGVRLHISAGPSF